jgi:hypothetical protein
MPSLPSTLKHAASSSSTSTARRSRTSPTGSPFPSDAAGRQTLRLYALSGNDARDDAATGELVLEGRTGETATGPDVRLWAGRTGDSFYVDLSLLAMVNSAVRDGTALDLSQPLP